MFLWYQGLGELVKHVVLCVIPKECFDTQVLVRLVSVKLILWHLSIGNWVCWLVVCLMGW